jgi:hypothetical protein
MSKPWLPYLASDYIEKIPHLNWVFEWGSGYSTLYFARRVPYIFSSVEHDPKWYTEVQDFLSPWPEYQKMHRLIEPEQFSLGNDPANPLHYKSGSTNLGGVNFKKYASVIDEYGLFDLILIDGMARASCLHHAFKHVAPGGCIVLDNTGDRPYYLEQTEAMFGNYETGWEKITMMGYGPILDYKWETTIFINKGKKDYE